MHLLGIGLAGALGSLSRYGVSVVAIHFLGRAFPFGTLAVNAIGALLLGLLMAQWMQEGGDPDPWRTAAATGFLGAFTTFSTFSYETIVLYEREGAGLAVANVAANLVLGLAAATLGMFLARQLSA